MPSSRPDQDTWNRHFTRPPPRTFYNKVMNVDPADPRWIGRDRFILSAGSSLTQYVQLYLTGFGLELEDIEKLCTAGSLTPGHPEVRHTKAWRSQPDRWERALRRPSVSP